MFSDDFIAERFRPDVRKSVLALGAAFDFFFILPPTSAPRRCVSFCRFHVDEGCVLLLLRQRSILASLQNHSHTSCSGPPSLMTLPMLDVFLVS